MATYARLPGQDEVSFQKFHSSSRLRIILCCGEWWPRRTRTLQRWAYLSNGSRTMWSSRHEVFPSVRLYSRSEFHASGASPSSLAHVQVRAIHTPTVGYPVLEAPASPQSCRTFTALCCPRATVYRLINVRTRLRYQAQPSLEHYQETDSRLSPSQPMLSCGVATV